MPNNNNNLLFKYAGLAMQLIIGLGMFLFAGIKIDNWLEMNTPIATWVLPLLFILSVIIKIVIDTGKKH